VDTDQLSDTDQADAPEDPMTLTLITELYVQVTGDRSAKVDWDLVEKVFREKRGIPVVIGYLDADDTEVEFDFRFDTDTDAGDTDPLTGQLSRDTGPAAQ
jgi:hypothetical protein